MNTINFYKYQGTGNDFVMIDDREESFDINAHQLIAKLCDRKFGIGADGLILIRNHTSADFEMVYYNADGYQTSLCGNGSRCAVHFAAFLGMFEDQCTFQTIEGLLKAKIEEELVEINMPDVASMESISDDYFLNTGSPHYVQFVNNVEKFDVYHQGNKIRNSDPYKKEGVNVNFVELVDENKIFVRTYERGVEDETFSCGTGVTASAIAFGSKKGVNNVHIKTLGGDLQVQFQSDQKNGGFCNVFLKGPAVMVFKGEIKIDSFTK